MSILLFVAALAAPAEISGSTLKRLQQAVAAAEAEDCPRALKLFDPMLKPGKAEELSDGLGAAVLTIAASCALQTGQRDLTYDLATRATKAGAEEPIMWQLRLERDFFAKRYEAAVVTVEELGNGYGATLSKVEARVFWQLHTGLVAANLPVLRQRLLKVLAESYAPTLDIGQPDGFRMHYARMLANGGDLAGAKAIVQGVTNPGTLRTLMVDPALRGTIPADFDLRAATERALIEQRGFSDANPDKLGPLLDVTALLRQLGRPAEAITALEQVRSKVAAGSYVDIDEFRPWWWDALSRSQERMGQIDAAIASLRSAIPGGESGGKNVSHIINLMQVLVDHGRFQEAIDVPQAAGGLGQMSPYGELQLRRARGCAYAALGRKAEAQADLDYARDNKAVDGDSYLDLLLCSGDQDAAAAEIIAQLGDADEVSSMLLRASTYAKPPVELPVSLRAKALRTVLARADVQAALKKAGGTRSFNVQESEH